MLWWALAFASPDEELEALIDAELEALAPPAEDENALRRVLRAEVEGALAWREARGMATTPDDLKRRVVGFEAFKFDAYVRSGVFPKRYFGYVDLRHDTAQHEWVLQQTTRCAVDVVNHDLASRGSDIRINDAEVVVTFLAEGGALMLQAPNSERADLDPVNAVGLVDLAKGVHHRRSLAKTLDDTCSAALVSSVFLDTKDRPPAEHKGELEPPPGHFAWLRRNLDFRELVVATALIWSWELERTDRELRDAGRPALMDRSRAGRFIAGALIYNSGELHDESTHELIRRFETGDYLYETSERNADRRPRLNLVSPTRLRAEWLSDQGYRSQPTTWSAVYHVLQRYGAWVALHRFADVFDHDGRFIERPSPPPSTPPTSPTSPSTGCIEGSLCAGLWPFLGFAWFRLRHGRSGMPVVIPGSE
ncbi:MAG: hypothetical protein AAGA48_28900 [Myxococcota bacterium]